MRRLKTVRQRFDDALAKLSWQDFERLMATYFASQGYRVEHVGTGVSDTRFDGGIDLKLYRDAHYFIVQCKHWNACQVTHNCVHELLGVMLTEHANGAIVVTSGEFSRAALAAAKQQPRIQLIDGAALRQMLGSLVDEFVPIPRQNNRADAGDFEPWRNVQIDPARYWSKDSPQKRQPDYLAVFVLVLVVVAVTSVYVAWLSFAHAARNASTPAMPTVRSVTHFKPTAVVRAKSAPNQFQQKRYDQTPMSEAELREWTRKNAESMKILEKTTPELGAH